MKSEPGDLVKREHQGCRTAAAAGGCGLSVFGVMVFAVMTLASFSVPSCDLNFGNGNFNFGVGFEDCTSGVFRTAADGDLSGTKRVLLEAPPGTVNSDGRSPLFCAASGSGPLSGRLSVARLLLDRGADTNRANAAGDTPLLWAADKGDLEMVRLLLDHGADPNQSNSQHQTPLLRATYRRSDDAAILLLNRGADPNIAGMVDPLSEYFLLAGASAAGVGSPETNPMLPPVTSVGSPTVASTAPVDTATPRPVNTGTVAPRLGYPPLVAAAANGDEVLVAALIQHNATINVVAGPGITPLYAAAQQGDEHIVGVLLLAGADPDFGVPPGGITPLAVANLGHHQAAVAILEGAEQAKTASTQRLPTR